MDASRPQRNGTERGAPGTNGTTGTGAKGGIFTAPELMGKQFAPPRYAVHGLLPEGLSILAGRPKMGKSYLALGIALAVAGGEPALGCIEVEPGDVLYLALEDGQRRLQRRLSEFLNDTPPPPRLAFATEWPALDKGGLAALDTWVDAHADARLVVIDTFKRVRPRGDGRRGVYDEDYEAVAPVADLAKRHAISVAVVMHTRKMEAEDPLDLISGSLGLSGAADGALVMRRQRRSADALLTVIDRDAEEKELALRWNVGTGGWLLLGDADEYHRSEQRNTALAALHDLGGATPKELAEHLGKPQGTIRKLFWGMVQAGLVTNAGGKYFALGPRPSSVPAAEPEK